MPNIPLAIFLIPYAIVLAVFGLFFLVNAYHLSRYGASPVASFWATSAFLAGTIVILFFTFVALSNVDWSAPINLGLQSFTTNPSDLLFP